MSEGESTWSTGGGEGYSFPKSWSSKKVRSHTKGCLADESTGVKALFVEESGVGSVDDFVLVCVL